MREKPQTSVLRTSRLEKPNPKAEVKTKEVYKKWKKWYVGENQLSYLREN